MEALHDIVKAGKALHIGASSREDDREINVGSRLAARTCRVVSVAGAAR